PASSRYPNDQLPDRFPVEHKPDALQETDRDPYVKAFFDLAHDLNIRVILVEVPRLEGEFEQRSSVPETTRRLLERYRNVTMAPDGWKRKFYPGHLFADPVHLNAE